MTTFVPLGLPKDEPKQAEQTPSCDALSLTLHLSIWIVSRGEGGGCTEPQAMNVDAIAFAGDDLLLRVFLGGGRSKEPRGRRRAECRERVSARRCMPSLRPRKLATSPLGLWHEGARGRQAQRAVR